MVAWPPHGAALSPTDGDPNSLSDIVSSTADGDTPRALHNPRTAPQPPSWMVTNAILKNITAHVQLVIPLVSLIPKQQLEKLVELPGFDTLSRLSGMNGAPMVNGHGPIPPDIARLMLGTSNSWDRILTDPVSGVVVTADVYTPTASLKRLINARDLHCRFPGCRVPLKYCDIDHTVDWALGGRTVPENLENLCIKHHRMKHMSEWAVTQRDHGVLTWTSPLGDTTIDRPVSTVVFKAITNETDDTKPLPPDAPPPF